MIEVTIEDTPDTAMRKKINSIPFTIVFYLFIIIYEIGVGFLFIIFMKDVNNPMCQTLVNWDISIIVLYLLSSIVNIIAFIIQLRAISLDSDTYTAKSIIFLRSIIHCLIGIIILIGVNVTYANVTDFKLCGEDFRILNLTYIIFEWIMIGIFIIVIIICIILVCIYKRKRN